MSNITVVGIGYVGFSLSVLLAQYHNVIALDVSEEKVSQINNRQAPVHDPLAEQFLRHKELDLSATNNFDHAFRNADYIIICTPTDYEDTTNVFDTSSVENVIHSAISQNQHAIIIIKSTVPVGFTVRMQKQFNIQRLLFSPEFLREGMALHDNLYPSRIVVGGHEELAQPFANLLLEVALIKEVPVVFTDPSEAEAVKLFSNTYLAMRVAYFNELDSYCAVRGLKPKQIIDAIGYDPRIGEHYNNPSFGYGGYCLPKDTKQLLANFQDVPSQMISAIVKANETRKNFIVQEIMQSNAQIIGVYRLIAKQGADNFRSSSVICVMERLQQAGKKIILYEPIIQCTKFDGVGIEKDLHKFKQDSDLIIANRIHADLKDVLNKVFTRDLYHTD